MTGLAGRAKASLAILLSAGTLAFAAPAISQELAPEHLALAREYIDLTDRAAIYEVTLVQTGIETMRTIVTQNPGIREQVDTAIGEVLKTYAGQKGDLLDQFARVYATRFSMEELQQIVDFYKTPVGDKLAQANLEINDDLQRVMQVFETNLKREFFAKVRAKLREDGVEL